uniref:Secreted protein n=1 Tax=Haematobia irritans TaxID=7368 RepID=A0A1L8E7A2_HAEIR
MLNRVHSNTTNLWPTVTLDLVLVVSTASLQNRFVDTTTTGNNTNHSTIGGRNHFLGTRWQLHTCLLGVWIMGNDGSIVSGGTCQTATITGFFLQIANDGTFRHLGNGHYVSNLESGFATTIDELSSVHTFGGNEKLLTDLVAVGVTEVDDG